MAAALASLHGHVADLINANGLEPQADSLASREQEDVCRRRALRDAYSLARKLHEAAGDHLWALSRMAAPREGMVRFAPWACTRSLVEACALGIWLFDPKVSAAERAARGFAVRYDGIDQQRKCLDAVAREGRRKGEDVEAREAEIASDELSQRLDRVANQAEELGLPPVLDRNRNRTGAGIRKPGWTDLAREALDAEASYRLLCAVVHAQPWALTQVGFTVSDPSYNTDEAGWPSELLETGRVDPEWLAHLCRVAASAFAKCTMAAASLFGWDCSGFQAGLRADLAEFGLQPPPG